MAKGYAARPEVQARIRELRRVLNGDSGFGLPGLGAAANALGAAAAAANKLAASALETSTDGTRPAGYSPQ